MQDKELTLNKETENIDLFEVLSVLSKNKKSIIISSLLLALIFGIYSLFLSDIYESESILYTSQNDSFESDGLTGLAALTGVSILNSQEGKMANIAIETIYSFNFLELLDEKYGIIFDLMAVKGWNRDKNELEIDHSLYDVKKNKWKLKNKEGKTLKPSIQESHEKFLSSLKIERLPESNFLKITFSHFSPEKAKFYLDAIIFEVNKIRMKIDIDESTRSIDFLKKEIENAKIKEVKVAMSRLIENQAKKSMFASTASEYILKTLSPPFIPENKSYPNRILLIFLGFISGIIFSSFYFLIKHFSLNKY